MKKQLLRFRSPSEERGSYYNVTSSLISMFPPTAPPLFFLKRQRCTSSNAMAKFRENHANCSVLGAVLTSTDHYLESQPQRRQESSGLIDLFTDYYTAATQI